MNRFPQTASFVRRLFAGAFLVAAVTVATPAQGAWSREFDMPGFGVGGRVFALGTWQNELIAGTYATPWRDGDRLNHVARFDGVRWRALGTGVKGSTVEAITTFSVRS